MSAVERAKVKKLPPARTASTAVARTTTTTTTAAWTTGTTTTRTTATTTWASALSAPPQHNLKRHKCAVKKGVPNRPCRRQSSANALLRHAGLSSRQDLRNGSACFFMRLRQATAARVSQYCRYALLCLFLRDFAGFYKIIDFFDFPVLEPHFFLERPDFIFFNQFS